MGWQRVWHYVDARRKKKGWSKTELYDRTDVSETTYRAMRTEGRPLDADNKVTTMCRALEWEDGSVDAILAGGEPVLLPGADDELAPELVRRLDDVGIRLAAIDEKLASIDEFARAATVFLGRLANGGKAPSKASPQAPSSTA